MAIRIIDEYPNRVGAPDTDYPQGVPRNVSAPGALDGTPWEQALLKDMQGLMQGLLEQVPAGPIVPSGTPDTVLVSQYIDAMKLIIQGLDITTFTSAELNTVLRLAPDGSNGLQWLATIAEELATAELNTGLVLSPDGLGGVIFTSAPVSAAESGYRWYPFTGAMDTFTVPAGITAITMSVWGAGGGGGGGGGLPSDGGIIPGGGGGGGGAAWRANAVATVPGETLNIFVGGGGLAGAPSSLGVGGFGNIVGDDGALGTFQGGGGAGGGGSTAVVRDSDSAILTSIAGSGGGGGGAGAENQNQEVGGPGGDGGFDVGFETAGVGGLGTPNEGGGGDGGGGATATLLNQGGSRDGGDGGDGGPNGGAAGTAGATSMFNASPTFLSGSGTGGNGTGTGATGSIGVDGGILLQW